MNSLKVLCFSLSITPQYSQCSYLSIVGSACTYMYMYMKKSHINICDIRVYCSGMHIKAVLMHIPNSHCASAIESKYT